MIYIITAIYPEAHPFITCFQLKKEVSHTRFQVFLNKKSDLCLVISGTGPIPAAAAVSSICTENNAGAGDFLLNVGICAQIPGAGVPIREAANPCQTGKIFLCSKITEQSTGRTFYPDLLYRHKFEEAQIVTGALPYEKSSPATAPTASCGPPDILLYDMEAAAIYQAGSYYLGPHQMSFLKVISDDGNPGNVTSGQIERLIDRNMENIADYITTLRSITSKDCRKGIFPNGHQNRIPQPDPAEDRLEKLCLDLHCSRTMSESVRQHIRYCILADIDYVSVLDEMYREGRIPCRDKREGKQRFHELKEKLL